MFGRMTVHTPEPMPVTGASAPVDSRAGKYLTFHLGPEHFGIPVQCVKEIMGVLDITPVPGTPVHLKGVINLRGKIVPVVDLRLKLQLPETPFTSMTCIIVVQVDHAGEKAPIGVIVDGVSEVLNLTGTEIEDAPDFGQGLELPYVLGLAKCRNGVNILLKIGEILNMQEIAGLHGLI